MTQGALAGLRVLDLSQGISGPFCARLLADYGAEVLKIEPPQGDILRTFGPFQKDAPHPEKCLFFLALNINKRGVTLNIETEGGRKLLRELVRDADVLVEGFKPGYLKSLGLGYDDLAKVNPGLVMTSITPFGQTGPYAQFEGEEIVYYAMGAIMSISGTSDREPLKHGGFQAQYEAGLNSAAATAVAAFARELTGEGQHIDVSITEVVNSTLVIHQPYYSFTGGIPGRRNSEGSNFGNPMPCKDGYVIAQTGGGATWDDIVVFYDRPELAEPRFADQVKRQEHGKEFDAIVVDAIKDRTKKELFKKAAEMHMLFGIAQDAKELSECPQLASRDFYREVEHPVMGRVRIPAVLFNMSGTPYQLRSSAPLLGQHNEEVYCGQLGYTKAELVRLRQVNII